MSLLRKTSIVITSLCASTATVAAPIITCNFNADPEVVFYHTVRFHPGDEGAILTGLTTVKVQPNWRLYMINTPTATLEDNVFIGWAKSSSPKIPLDMNQPITSDLDLVPVFIPAVSKCDILVYTEDGYFTNKSGQPYGNYYVLHDVTPGTTLGQAFINANNIELETIEGDMQGLPKVYSATTEKQCTKFFANGAKATKDTQVTEHTTLKSFWSRTSPINFAETDWNELSDYCMEFEGSSQSDEDVKTFCNHFSDTQYDSSLTVKQNWAKFLDKEINIKINGINQPVKVIGMAHDTIAKSNIYNVGKKAALTFQTKYVLCDSDGNSLTTMYNNVESKPTANYLDSTLRKTLDGRGSADSSVSYKWGQKGGTSPSTTYNTSVLNMLTSSSALKVDYLRTVDKYVHTSDNPTAENPFASGLYSTKTYDAQVFIPTYFEYKGDTESIHEENSYRYEEYDRSNSKDPSGKFMHREHIGQISDRGYKHIDTTTISGGVVVIGGNNYAGYNEYCGSTTTGYIDTDSACYLSSSPYFSSGETSADQVHYYAGQTWSYSWKDVTKPNKSFMAIIPCFCI